MTTMNCREFPFVASKICFGNKGSQQGSGGLIKELCPTKNTQKQKQQLCLWFSSPTTVARVGPILKVLYVTYCICSSYAVVRAQIHRTLRSEGSHGIYVVLSHVVFLSCYIFYSLIVSSYNRSCERIFNGQAQRTQVH